VVYTSKKHFSPEKPTVKEAIEDVMIEAKGWLYKSEIASLVWKKHGRVCRNQETIFRELRRLVEDGKVRRMGEGKNTKYRWVFPYEDLG